MKVLLTSAHGFVGSRITPLLLSSGHTVYGLARSPTSAETVKSLGVTPVLLSLEDGEKVAEYIKSNSINSVIHTAFNHDFSKYYENVMMDLKFIRAVGGALASKGDGLEAEKSFIITYGMSASSEDVSPSADHPNPRTQNEPIILKELTGQGIKAMIVRLPPSVHGENDHAFVPMLISAARDKKCSAYIQGGKGVWSAVHVKDAARLYVHVLNRGEKGGVYHAVGDKGVKFEEIAKVIGEKLDVEIKGVKQEEIGEYLGFLAGFAGADLGADNEITKKAVGWEPKEKGLLQDMREGDYFSTK